MTWISDGEFKRRHKEHLAGAWWGLFRHNALIRSNYNCCVCGKDYLKRGIKSWQLQVDHRSYRKNGKLIFGHETFSDVRVVCPPHHGKGVRSDFHMREWRRSQQWLKALIWLLKLPWRILGFVFGSFGV